MPDLLHQPLKIFYILHKKSPSWKQEGLTGHDDKISPDFVSVLLSLIGQYAVEKEEAKNNIDHHENIHVTVIEKFAKVDLA